MRFLGGIRKILRRPHLSIVALRLPPLTTHCDARARYSDVNNECARRSIRVQRPTSELQADFGNYLLRPEKVAACRPQSVAASDYPCR